MKRSKGWPLLALLFALMLVAAACAEDEGGDGDGGGQSAQDVCDADEFGCVEIQEGDPITLGTLMVISGTDASLGLDSQHGAELAAMMRDNEVVGHPIEWQHEDDLCTAEGGQSGGQSLASNEEVVAAIGNSCSSAGEPGRLIMSEGGDVLHST